jgi:hypothetical protein
MYLGNSAKIGILDKGGKWRKKDWYLQRDHLEGEELELRRGEAMRRDQERMNVALGIGPQEDEEKLTPAEMQMLLKKIKGGKEDAGMAVAEESAAIGLGFDKARVEIRAKPTTKVDNPHRLEGTGDDGVKVEARESDEEIKHVKKEKKEKKDKKEKKERRHRDRSESRDPPRKKHEEDSDDDLKKKKKHRHRSPSASPDRRKERRRSPSNSRERERDRRHNE